MTSSHWIVRAILRAWPNGFRQHHGHALAQVFAQSWRDASGPGACWQRTALVADTVASGLRERRGHHPHDWSITMRSLVTSFQSARRALQARPLATLAVVLTLGIGLGATVAMFAVVDAVLLRPLPYPDDGRLVTIIERHATRPLSGASIPAARDWERLDGVAALGMFTDSSGVLRVNEPVRVDGVMVSPRFFETLGVTPALGRTPIAGDPFLEPAAKIVISDRLWRSQFNARADVIGQPVRIDNRTYTAIGVMPPGFSYPAGSEFWTTLSPNLKFGMDERGLRFMARVVARLAPGTTVESLQQRIAAWETAARASDAKAMTGWRIDVRTLRDDAVGAVRPQIVVAFSGVGLLLLVACCNIAAMLLAQGRARQRALAMQSALGATRSQLVAQLFVEGLLMAAAGSAIALAFAAALRSAIVALSLEQIPRIDLVQIDLRVVAFVVAAALATTVVFALGPALAVARVDAATLLGRVTRTVAGDRRRLLSVLVATEFALALALVAAAGLLVNSYRQLLRVDLGFTPAGAAVARVNIPIGAPWNDEGTRRRFYDEALSRVRAIPGIEAAGFVARLPLEPVRGIVDVWPAGRRADAVGVVLQEASEGYLAAIGARLIEGRDFSLDDRAGQPVAVLVNDLAARLWWPGESAVGKPVDYDFMRGRVSAVVAGVVKSVRYDGVAGEAKPEVYGTFRQGLVMPATIVFRSTEPMTLLPAIRSAVQSADPTRSVTLDNVASFDQRVDAQLARPRFFLALVGTFAAIAFVLAALGVYGTLSFWIAERRRELGIRVALGATRRQIAGLVVRRGLAIAAAGLGTGLLLTLGTGRYLRSLLFAVSPSDPFTLAAAAAILGLVAAVACWLPARRAAAVDPLEILRD